MSEPVKITVRPNGRYRSRERCVDRCQRQAMGSCRKPASSCAAAAPSENRPFCDGAHKKVGFQDAASPEPPRRSLPHQFDPGDLYPVSNRILPIAPVRSLTLVRSRRLAMPLLTA